MQIRGSDGRAYRPGRDISYVFQKISRHASYRLARDSWNEVIRDYASFSGLTEQALIPAGEALAKFYALVTSGNIDNMAQAMFNSGLTDLPKPVLMAVFFELGAGVMSEFFNAAREVTQLGKSAPGADSMADAALKAAWAVKTDLPSARASRVGEVLSPNEEKGG